MYPLVSIAIPTFDRLHYLKEAVGSALSQTYGSIEILIGDDGQSEDIKAWGESAARQNPKVRYLRNARNLGLAGNWNALADAAKGEYLVVIGDDDRLLPEFVEKLVGIIRPGAHVAFSNHYLINGDGTRLIEESLKHTKYYGRDRLRAGELRNAASWVWQNSIPLVSSLVRTDAVRDLRFKDDLNTPEIELFLRLERSGRRFVFTPEYLAEYRTHTQSSTATGLWGERLVKYLTVIPAGPEAERYKREFMTNLLIHSVSRCLLRGDIRQAQSLMDDEYYPGIKSAFSEVINKGSGRGGRSSPTDRHLDRSPLLKRAITCALQKICAQLPPPLVSGSYRAMRGLKPSSRLY